ncbi:MAG: alginate export family protein [Pseudomonadota bacterium]
MVRKLVSAVVAALVIGQPAHAQTNDPLLFYKQNGLAIRGHFQAGINLVGEENLFWNLSDTFAPTADFDPDTVWFESYAKPGLSFDYRFAPHNVFYGKVSTVLSDTRGIDAYDTGNTGRVTLEDAYLGYRFERPDGLSVDISGGRRPLKLGTGMLVENGGSSGFERGALKLGPRKSWERAAIAKFGFANLTSTTFYLDPNETEANDSRNELAGTDLRYDSKQGGYAGITYLNVLESEAPYPKAAPGGVGIPSVIPNARDGLNALNFYGRTARFHGPLSGLFFTTDVAYEWNDDIDLRAWAARGQVGYTFEQSPWRPMVMYTYQTFSGDNPDTATLERFDPLFFEGSPSSWATGSKSSFTFINSNVQAHQITLSISPTSQDRFTLRYAHIRANELRSPVQFGQAARFDVNTGEGVIAGVTDPHLADDVFLEYSRIINKNTFFTAGVSASVPGKGLKDAVGTAGGDGDLPIWLGGFVNIVVNY